MLATRSILTSALRHYVAGTVASCAERPSRDHTGFSQWAMHALEIGIEVRQIEYCGS